MALTISGNGASQAVYLQQNGGVIEYSVGATPGSYTAISNGQWPVTINNTPSPGDSSILRVIATTNLTLTGSYGSTSGYLIAGSTYITFDGSGNTITLDGITSYPGFIQNGTSGANGQANIIVQNFTTTISGASTLTAQAGWLCQSYFGKGVLGNTITGCANSILGVISAINAGGIVGSFAGSSGGLLNITNCNNAGQVTGDYAGGITGSRFGYNTSNTCVISGCYNAGTLISGSNTGGIVGADVGFNDSTSPSYTPVVNITNSYSLGAIAATCGGICGGTDPSSVYINSPTITITNCYSSGTIVNANSGIVSTSYPKPTTKTNVYVAGGTWWVNSIANANLTGTPTNFNTPGSTWTMVNPGYPYVLSAYNAALYSPSSASGTNTYSSAQSVFGSTSGYTYIIININQVANVATIKVFAYKGNLFSRPYAYNYNTFTFTDTNGITSRGKMSSTINQTTGSLSITKSANNISATGGTQSIYLQMSGDSMQYSVGSTPGAWTTITTWPMTITNLNPGSSSVLRVVATQALTISSSTGGATNGYFIAGSEYITFDGSGNTITINTIRFYNGFIENGRGSTGGSNGFANIVVQNFITNTSGDSTLSIQSGWLCREYFGRNVSANSITGCTNNGAIASNAGGIAGNFAATYGGSLTITNCTNNGAMTGNGGNGITGNISGGLGGSITITNCTNNGAMSGVGNCGGIVATNTATFGGLATIINCTNTGSIIGGVGSAGIVGGSSSGGYGGTMIITGCTNTGDISIGSPILANEAGNNNGLVTITNCTNSGTLSGQVNGLIGDKFGYNTNQTCSITNCYNISNISGTTQGGIVGSGPGYSNSALYSPSVNISNCYSLGTIASGCGGIVGGWPGYYATPANKATLTINNCYSYGTIATANSGIVAASYTSTYVNLTQTNTYVANGTWSDTTANANLTGTPTNINTNNPGTTWTMITAGTPYVLSAYNATLYNPSSAAAANTYTSTQGLFQSGYTYRILYTSQVNSTATTRVFASKGNAPYYNSYNSNTFVITNTSGSSDLITALITSSNGVLNYTLPGDSPPSPYPCFLEGSNILCFENNEEVYRRVESLQKGDLVKTIYNGYMPICMMGTKSIYNPGNDDRFANRLYKCSIEKYPSLFEDLYITGCHSILVSSMTNDQWENTKAVNGNIYVTDNHFRLIACADEKAEPYNKEGFMNIYHIALDHHDICMNYGIYANGLLVESCSIEYLIKYSNLKILGEADCAVSEDSNKISNNMISELVDTY
jgi:hypothetical protein